ncbi:dihydroxy-acid dehydratase [Dethiosulfatibacter aminovorans DSM 17477]|uniref:Dihydroxy-acid dehydratase n=1 Tax=Dethiosulfatibacter aminovorans DSM 17477 TaxID=1121476 RepID=A0A1M6MNZ5_9FIRM|nr:dihydroxy-acid dehydratase [Dethiosulfatibacter aminovorans]SHJ85201.1 dihydroxy-acid dehydratase [Dethiosulfatibacter aminovorans DSM 17477]
MNCSQKSRMGNPEFDPMLLGTGWTPEDLEKPYIMLESSYGDSHPGSKHLNQLVDEAANGIYKRGGKPAKYTVTDICDGVACGHSGMNYSLLSRDIMSSMVEIHAKSVPYDGMITFASCDKSLPAHLMAIARVDIPSIHFCGGTMLPGPEFITPVKGYEVEELKLKGEISPEDEIFYKTHGCPTHGACQYMGTANTMQVTAEALGLSLPFNGLMPAWSNFIKHYADQTGQKILELLEKDIRPSRILTKEAFENAIMVHAAVSGSTNALLHIPAIAKCAGVEITMDDFDRIHRRIPVLTSLQMSGKWPVQMLWFAGGVPGIMLEIEKYLNLEVMTVTGKTLGENLEEIKRFNKIKEPQRYLSNYMIKPEEVITPLEDPYNPDGGLAILYGNLAPEGSAVKHAAVPKLMHVHEGPAKVYDSEDAAIKAIFDDAIRPGDVIVIRYEGPKGSGMPEMFKATEVLYNKEHLRETTALITDGRFSGASRGPAVGHMTPEAANGGPIAYLMDGDIIKIDIPGRKLEITGFGDKKMTDDEVRELLDERRRNIKIKEIKHEGVLGLFTRNAGNTKEGASMF